MKVESRLFVMRPLGALAALVFFAGPTFAGETSNATTTAAQRHAENVRAAQEAAAEAQSVQDEVSARHDAATRQWERQQRRKYGVPKAADKTDDKSDGS